MSEDLAAQPSPEDAAVGHIPDDFPMDHFHQATVDIRAGNFPRAVKHGCMVSAWGLEQFFPDEPPDGVTSEAGCRLQEDAVIYGQLCELNTALGGDFAERSHGPLTRGIMKSLLLETLKLLAEYMKNGGLGGIIDLLLDS